MNSRSHIPGLALFLFVVPAVVSTASNAALLRAQWDIPPNSSYPVDYCDGIGGSLGDCSIADTWTGSAPYAGMSGSLMMKIDGTGLHLGARSEGIDKGGPRAILNATDQFTINTVSGVSEAFLDAAMGFSFSGELFVPSKDRSRADVGFSVSAAQTGVGSFQSSQSVYAEYDSATHSMTDVSGSLSTLASISSYDDPDHGSGMLYSWNDIKIAYALTGVKADLPIDITFSLRTSVSPGSTSNPYKGGRSDFSSTFETDLSNIFEITDGPEGSAYRVTSSIGIADASIFGPLETESVLLSPPDGGTPGTAPAPPILSLLGLGLAGIGFQRRRMARQ